MYNMELMCPDLATVLRNTYQDPCACFFLMVKSFCQQRVHTTQGDPLGMAMLTIMIRPPIWKPHQMCKEVY